MDGDGVSAPRGALAALELRVPPLLLAVVLLGGVLWIMRPWTQQSPFWQVAFAALLATLGIAVCVSGVIAFRRARTTVDPLHPERASQLVVAGIYRATRNPMYLGFALLLAGAALWSGGWIGWLALALFVAWIDRLQIVPEERALRARFGGDFDDYCRRVRRWL